jgi:tetratricopeptide (TPR) repeat protein
MNPWKVAASYFVPAGVFIALLASNFFSHFGLLERWFLGENEIRQIVSLPPEHSRGHDGKHLEMDNAGQPSSNGYVNSDENPLRMASRTAEAYFNQALAYEKSSRLEEAIQAYQQALVHKQDFPYALLNLGVLYYRREEWQNARDAFEEALSLDKNYVKAYFNLSLVYKKLGEPDKAAQAARQVVALNNKDATVYNRSEGL